MVSTEHWALTIFQFWHSTRSERNLTLFWMENVTPSCVGLHWCDVLQRPTEQSAAHSIHTKRETRHLRVSLRSVRSLRKRLYPTHSLRGTIRVKRTARKPHTNGERNYKDEMLCRMIRQRMEYSTVCCAFAPLFGQAEYCGLWVASVLLKPLSSVLHAVAFASIARSFFVR